LGDEKAVPIGRLSKTIFEKNGITWSEVEKNLKFKSLTVNELGLQIQAGSLDAVIVWDAVARYFAQYGDEVPIPAQQNVVSTVDAGVLRFARNRKLAEKFVEFMRSERGRAVFRKHNYRVDQPR
jgi:molybdate transport system substrate-binding protein